MLIGHADYTCPCAVRYASTSGSSTDTSTSVWLIVGVSVGCGLLLIVVVIVFVRAVMACCRRSSSSSNKPVEERQGTGAGNDRSVGDNDNVAGRRSNDALELDDSDDYYCTIPDEYCGAGARKNNEYAGLGEPQPPPQPLPRPRLSPPTGDDTPYYLSLKDDNKYEP